MNKKVKGTEILKVLVGSRAHGLANPDSDYDYRGVYVAPTSEILKLGTKLKASKWIEGEKDSTSYEIGHFLHLATHCNPTILEVFVAPVKEATSLGKNLREQFPRVWNSTGVKNAFIGYGLNQRKKFLKEKDKRPDKYATAYLRTLIQAYYLLFYQKLIVDMSNIEEFDTLKRFKSGEYEVGEVIQKCYDWQKKVEQAFEMNPDKKTDYDQINAFLLKVRRRFW